MSNVSLQEVAIAIAAKNLNPTALNLDFLQYSDIIPVEWELARPPVYTNQLVQLIFKNGLGLVAQPNRIFFAEILGTRALGDVQAAEIACKCVEKLSKLDYQSVGINITGYTIYDSEEAAHRYLCHSLLSPGEWQEFGEARVQAGLQLAYTLKRGQLNLGINQARITVGEQTVPGIVFSGNFNYPVSDDPTSAHLEELQQTIRNWRSDLALYQALIDQKFLQNATSVDALPTAASA